MCEHARCESAAEHAVHATLRTLAWIAVAQQGTAALVETFEGAQIAEGNA